MTIRLFSTDDSIPQEVDVDMYKNEVLLLGKPEHLLPRHMALYSTVRNRGSLRIHTMFRLLVKWMYVSLLIVDITFQHCSITWRKYLIGGGIHDVMILNRKMISLPSFLDYEIICRIQKAFRTLITSLLN